MGPASYSSSSESSESESESESSSSASHEQVVNEVPISLREEGTGKNQSMVKAGRCETNGRHEAGAGQGIGMRLRDTQVVGLCAEGYRHASTPLLKNRGGHFHCEKKQPVTRNFRSASLAGQKVRKSVRWAGT